MRKSDDAASNSSSSSSKPASYSIFISYRKVIKRFYLKFEMLNVFWHI